MNLTNIPLYKQGYKPQPGFAVIVRHQVAMENPPNWPSGETVCHGKIHPFLSSVNHLFLWTKPSISMGKWPIYRGLPMKNGHFPWRTASHNQIWWILGGFSPSSIGFSAGQPYTLQMLTLQLTSLSSHGLGRCWRFLRKETVMNLKIGYCKKCRLWLGITYTSYIYIYDTYN